MATFNVLHSRSFPGQTKAIDLCQSMDLLFVGNDNSITIYRWISMEKVATLSRADASSLNGISVSIDGRYVAVSNSTGSVSLLCAQSGEAVNTILPSGEVGSGVEEKSLLQWNYHCIDDIDSKSSRIKGYRSLLPSDFDSDFRELYELIHTPEPLPPISYLKSGTIAEWDKEFLLGEQTGNSQLEANSISSSTHSNTYVPAASLAYKERHDESVLKNDGENNLLAPAAAAVSTICEVFSSNSPLAPQKLPGITNNLREHLRSPSSLVFGGAQLNGLQSLSVFGCRSGLLTELLSGSALYSRVVVPRSIVTGGSTVLTTGCQSEGALRMGLDQDHEFRVCLLRTQRRGSRHLAPATQALSTLAALSRNLFLAAAALSVDWRAQQRQQLSLLSALSSLARSMAPSALFLRQSEAAAAGFYSRAADPLAQLELHRLVTVGACSGAIGAWFSREAGDQAWGRALRRLESGLASVEAVMVTRVARALDLAAVASVHLSSLFQADNSELGEDREKMTSLVGLLCEQTVALAAHAQRIRQAAAHAREQGSALLSFLRLQSALYSPGGAKQASDRETAAAAAAAAMGANDTRLALEALRPASEPDNQAIRSFFERSKTQQTASQGGIFGGDDNLGLGLGLEFGSEMGVGGGFQKKDEQETEKNDQKAQRNDPFLPISLSSLLHPFSNYSDSDGEDVDFENLSRLAEFIEKAPFSAFADVSPGTKNALTSLASEIKPEEQQSHSLVSLSASFLVTVIRMVELEYSSVSAPRELPLLSVPAPMAPSAAIQAAVSSTLASTGCSFFLENYNSYPSLSSAVSSSKGFFITLTLLSPSQLMADCFGVLVLAVPVDGGPLMACLLDSRDNRACLLEGSPDRGVPLLLRPFRVPSGAHSLYQTRARAKDARVLPAPDPPGANVEGVLLLLGRESAGAPEAVDLFAARLNVSQLPFQEVACTGKEEFLQWDRILSLPRTSIHEHLSPASTSFASVAKQSHPDLDPRTDSEENANIVKMFRGFLTDDERLFLDTHGGKERFCVTSSAARGVAAVAIDAKRVVVLEFAENDEEEEDELEVETSIE